VLTLCLTYVLCSALYFYYLLEEHYYSQEHPFNYATAVYFTLATFLTIGYGDYVPVNGRLTLVSMCIIFVGLALVAASIDVIRTKISVR